MVNPLPSTGRESAVPPERRPSAHITFSHTISFLTTSSLVQEHLLDRGYLVKYLIYKHKNLRSVSSVYTKSQIWWDVLRIPVLGSQKREGP